MHAARPRARGGHGSGGRGEPGHPPRSTSRRVMPCPRVVMPTLVLKGGTRVRTRPSAGSRCSSKPRASAGGELGSVPFNSSLQHDAAGADRRVNPARDAVPVDRTGARAAAVRRPAPSTQGHRLIVRRRGGVHRETVLEQGDPRAALSLLRYDDPPRSMASSRSDSEPLPVSNKATPAVACGTRRHAVRRCGWDGTEGPDR